MRVVIDGSSFRPTRGGGLSGVGRWTTEIINAIARDSPDWHFDLLSFKETHIGESLTALGNVHVKKVAWSVRRFRAMRAMGLLSRLENVVGKFDVALGTGFVTWPSDAAEIPVIYDLSYLRYPETLSRLNLYFLKSVMPRVVRRAARIVVVSSSIRDEVVETYGADPSKFSLVPPGGDHIRTMISASASRSSDIPEERFLLFVGTQEPRKNLTSLLEVHSALRRKEAETPRLFLVGGRGWRNAPIEALIAKLESEDHVRALGYVEDEELISLYRRATAIVMPSLYEGFGIPVLEAMICGCPVIASDIAPLRELAGDAALFVDPLDHDSLIEAISHIVDDEGLRQRLAAAGKARGENYSWSRSAQELKRCIEMAVSS